MNTENLLKKASLETLLAVFFNSSQKPNGNFAVQTNYRKGTSKYFEKIILNPSSYQDTAKRLSKKYNLDFKQVSSTIVEAEIINERSYTLDEFTSAVYESILPKLTFATNYDIELAKALFVFRGSPDFTLSFYSVNLKHPSESYNDNLFKLLLSTDELLSRLNLNFRELQPEYVNGIAKRNTQIRINLKWYYENVAKTEILNEFKYDVMAQNYTNLGEIRKPGSFEERWILYRQSILNRQLSSSEINSMRDALNFTSKEAEEHPENTFTVRNQKIVAYARETFADICVGCHHKYHIKDRSFLMPRNNRYYFEINHVIPYANDSKAVDVLDNLVKLCPICHRALTPNRAFPELQKEIIKNELDSRPEVKQFVLSKMPNPTLSPVDYIYGLLK